MVAVIEILALANVCLVLVVVYLIRELARQDQRYMFRLDRKYRIPETPKPPQPQAQNPPPAAKTTPKLNAMQARRVMEGVNREYFSADRKKTNSEILKEQEHG